MEMLANSHLNDSSLIKIIKSDPRAKRMNLTESDLEFLLKIFPEREDAYVENICKKRYSLLKSFFDELIFIDKNETLKKIGGKQTLHLSNHQSHFDYLWQFYNIYKSSGSAVRIAARENVFIPFLKKAWKKCGAIKLPFERMDQRESKLVNLALRAVVNNGDSILAYAEGGRSYDNNVKEFKTGAIKTIINAAQDFEKNLTVVFHYITYTHPIEEPYFNLLKKLKYASRTFYQLVDLYAFAKRYLCPKGIAYHYVGRSINGKEFKNSEELCEIIREEIINLKINHEKSLV